MNLHKRVLEAKNTVARGSQILRALAQAGGLLGIALGSALPVIASGQIGSQAMNTDSPGILLAQNEPEDAPPPPPPPPEEPPSEIPPPVDEPTPPSANSAPQPPPGGGNAPGRPGAAAPGASGGAIPVDPSGIPAKKIPPGEELVTIDFPEPIPIKDIIKAVAQWTGKNFILGQGVSSSARVAIISPQQVTKEEAYQAFLSALNVAGFTTVDTGRIVKIIPTRQATSSNIKTFYGASWAPMTDEIITQIIPLTYIDAQTVATQLKSILRESNAVPFPTTNSLIVSDTGHKIRRLLEIILLLDVKGNQPQVAIVPILYMDAADVAKKIQDIFGRGGAKAGGSLYLQKVIIDERSNSTILIGPPRGLDDVVRLIKRLDRALEDQSQQAQIHVRPLEYADATKLAGTLQALAQGSADNRAGALRARARAGNPPGAPGAPGARPGEGDPISVADLGNVKITADSPTNSLIIQGSTAAFKEIDNIIRMLDRRKSQVFVEADIIDVNVAKNLSISGSGFAGFSDNNFVYPFGWQPAVAAGFSALSAGGAASSAQASTLISGLGPQAVFGVLSKQSIKIADNLSLTPGAFIFALKKDENSNVLQTPSMLVADNEEAEFVATEQANIFVLQTNATNGIATEKNEPLNAELSLKLKPQVSKADIVNMDLGLKADSFGRRDDKGRPAETLKRAFSTKVSVQDGQTIVISGLQRDIDIEGQAKVPLLGDIPIIGWLFRNSSNTRQKTNLMIFLTPYVVRDASDLSRIYDKKMRDQEEFLQKFYGEDYRDRDVFKRMPNRSDGRVPPPRVSKESTGSSDASTSTSDQKSPGGSSSESPAGSAPAGAPTATGDSRKVETITDEQSDAGIALPSRDPDPIVVPGSDAMSGGGGGGGGGSDFGGSAAPPPPPPPPPPSGGEGDQGGGE